MINNNSEGSALGDILTTHKSILVMKENFIVKIAIEVYPNLSVKCI